MTTERKNSAGNGCENCQRAPKWRTDFPIEWERDHYVSRREMVKFLTLGSVLLAAANWVAALVGRLLHTSTFPAKMVGLAPTLDQQQSLLFRYPTDKDPCIAVRTPDGKLVAYSQVCTSVTKSTVPTWLSDEKKVTLVQGKSSSVTLTLYKNGRAKVTVDFADQEDGGTDAQSGSGATGVDGGTAN